MNGFDYSENSVSADEIDQAENEMGLKIPLSLRSHFLQCNGGVPKKSWWESDEWEPLSVGEFMPIKYPIDSDTTLEKTYIRTAKKNILPEDFVPFATDWGGNFFCIDAVGAIFFYAMDAWSGSCSLEENKRNATRFLCGNLPDFIDGLKAEDECY